MNTADQSAIGPDDLAVRTVGRAGIPSPMAAQLQDRPASVHYVDETDRVLVDDTLAMAGARGLPAGELPAFEPGGPRRMLYFDPARTRAGIVTCGGLCPGLNDVIRGLVLQLTRYGVHDIVGFGNGYQGLIPDYGHPVTELTPAAVRNIHTLGGTILGTSRGDQDPVGMVDTLERLDVSILFVIGGDGSMRGALKIADEAAARGLDIAVVGVPKTIDNDIPYIDHSFGFQTAFARAAESIRAAHTEATSTPHGLGLVKLMGRHSGFIACYAALANGDADFVLVPEVPFRLEGDNGFLRHLCRRVERQGHAIVVVAEGAGQDLVQRPDTPTDASGNVRLADIGQLIRERVVNHFQRAGVEMSLRYIDPSYAIRSVPANPFDNVYCGRLAHAAVHAAMAGRTAMVIGRWHGRFIHLPIPLATQGRNQVDPHGDLWMSVLESTGQPARFG